MVGKGRSLGISPTSFQPCTTSLAAAFLLHDSHGTAPQASSFLRVTWSLGSINPASSLYLFSLVMGLPAIYNPWVISSLLMWFFKGPFTSVTTFLFQIPFMVNT